MNTQLQTPPHSPPNQLNMVSHPELADRSRRAPSVSSRTSHSKHHRGRSHHGGSSYHPQNEFPFFAQTGDVEIVISAEGQEKRYLLHRLILDRVRGSSRLAQAKNGRGARPINKYKIQPQDPTRR